MGHETKEMPGQVLQDVWSTEWTADDLRWHELMGEPRIYADLMKRSGNSVILTCTGTRKDLHHFGIILEEGLLVPFWTDDADNDGNDDPLLFEGYTHFDKAHGYWTAIIDFGEIRHFSDVRKPSTTA